MSTPIEVVERPAASHLTSKRRTDPGEELERQRCFRMSSSRSRSGSRRTTFITRCGPGNSHPRPHRGGKSNPVQHRRRAESAPDGDLRKLRALRTGDPIRTPGEPADGQALHACQYATETSFLPTTFRRWLAASRPANRVSDVYTPTTGQASLPPTHDSAGRPVTHKHSQTAAFDIRACCPT